MASDAAGERGMQPDLGGQPEESEQSERATQAEDATDGRRLRWAEHRARRRAAFVAAGGRAIDRHGPDASAEQMAEAAGVSRTVLYRYFRDREDLRQAIADEAVASVVASVLPNLELSADSTPRHIISSVVEVIVGWLDRHPNLYYFLRDRRNGTALETVQNTIADQVATMLKALLLHFGIDDRRAEPSAYGIVGFVESSGSWWLSGRTMPRDEFTETVCQGVWYLFEGTARANHVVVGYDDPLSIEPAAGEPGQD
jgi:AcrR family transcriptional regulator